MSKLHQDAPREGCADFQRRLLQAVLDGEALLSLAWDEHLLACPACRALTESEEQLDELLAAWRAPSLDAATRERLVGRVAAERALDVVLARDTLAAPRDFATRILVAVRRRLADEIVPESIPESVAESVAESATGATLLDARVLSLDAALEQESLRAPAGLASRTAAAVRARLADDALEALLRHDRVVAPTGLAGRVQAALRAAARRDEQVAATPTPRRRFTLLRMVVATASAAAVLALAWLARRDAGGGFEPSVVPLAQRDEAISTEGGAPRAPDPLTTEAQVDEGLLGDLELLEEVAVLLDGDLELFLSTMDASDEALLDMDAYEPPATTEEPSKG